MSPLHVGNASFEHESTNVPDINAKQRRNLGKVNQARRTVRARRFGLSRGVHNLARSTYLLTPRLT